MSPMREHVHELRVAYSDTDRMGVIHHANFIRYFEQARIEFMRRNGVVYSDMEHAGYFFVVKKVFCDYLANVAFDQTIRIRTWLTEVGKVSLKFEYQVFSENGAVLANAHTVLACVDKNWKLARMPLEVANRLNSL